MADELEKLTKTHQIIVITHQPIIASKSNKHFHVKKSQNVETQIEVRIPEGDEKVNVIAELAAGEVNEQSLEFARSLIRSILLYDNETVRVIFYSLEKRRVKHEILECVCIICELSIVYVVCDGANVRGGQIKVSDDGRSLQY